MDKIKVMIVDDQRIMQDGLKTILQLSEDLEVVGLASDGQEAVEKVKNLQPEVVLMDIRMPKMDGVEATKIIKERYPETVIIILTTFDDDAYIMNAMSHGAAGYLLKDIDGEQLVKAIKDGKNGSIIMPGRVAAKIVAKLNTGSVKEEVPPSNELSMFSERELEVIRCIMEGKDNKEIAKLLYLTEGTVKNYVSLIYSKIDVTNRANAVIYFKKMGL